MKWKRYRFSTRSVEDCRPLIFNPHYPWWLSSSDGDGQFVTIVAYLPAGEPLERYWDDAFDIDVVEKEEISFSKRFPKPSYYQE